MMTKKNYAICIIIFILAFVVGSLCGEKVSKKQSIEIISELKTTNQMIQDQLDTAHNELIDEFEERMSLSEELTMLKDELYDANKMIGILKSEQFIIGTIVREEEINMIAQTVWGEARGLSTIEQSMVVWCILNRVDNGYWGNTVAEVITCPNQFHGYHESYPIQEEFVALVKDVIARWQVEKYCVGNVGRTLPSKYLYFHAKDGRNIFKTNYTQPYEVYDWSSCWNPYE